MPAILLLRRLLSGFIKRHPVHRYIRKWTTDNPSVQNSMGGRLLMAPLIRYRTRRAATTKPATVIVENTSFCNATCVMCPHATGFKRDKGFVDDGLFQKILDEMVRHKIRRLQLNGTGEPMLDKKLAGKIRLAKDLGVPETYFYTNASLLNAERGEEILDSGLDELRISFDGLTPSEYERIRVGLNYDVVSANILGFLRMKKARGQAKPFVYVTGFVTIGTPELERLDVYRELVELADQVDIVSYDEGVHSWGGNIEVGSAFALQAGSYWNFPCRRLWDEFNVHSDGIVVACCVDHEGVLEMGNMKTSSIMEIWQSNRFTELRQMHVQRRLGEIDLCRDCSERPSWLPPSRH